MSKGRRPTIDGIGRRLLRQRDVQEFFATLECELLDRTSFRDHDEARTAIFDFIEGWYNTRRRHSSIGYNSPVQFERNQVRVA